jgi:hypothetical protein
VEASGPRGYSESIETNIERNVIMNILKNMEAVFLVSLAIAGPASVVLDSIPEANARSVPEALVATGQAIPVVVVSARRMTDAEKRASLADEARQGKIQMAARGSI